MKTRRVSGRCDSDSCLYRPNDSPPISDDTLSEQHSEPDMLLLDRADCERAGPCRSSPPSFPCSLSQPANRKHGIALLLSGGDSLALQQPYGVRRCNLSPWSISDGAKGKLWYLSEHRSWARLIFPHRAAEKYHYSRRRNKPRRNQKDKNIPPHYARKFKIKVCEEAKG